MASQNNLLNKLAALVASFDDAAWETLASKGLLRRARKDLEKGERIELLEETPSFVKLAVQSFVVSVPESGPPERAVVVRPQVFASIFWLLDCTCNLPQWTLVNRRLAQRTCPSGAKSRCSRLRD